MTISRPAVDTVAPDEPDEPGRRAVVAVPVESATIPSAPSVPVSVSEKGDFPYHVRRRWPALVIVGTQLALDLLGVAAAFYIVWQGDNSLKNLGFEPPSKDTYKLILAVLLATVLVVFNVAGLYTLKRGVSRVDEFIKICSATSIGVVLGLAVNVFIFGGGVNFFTRQLLIAGWGLAILFVTGERLLYSGIVSTLRRRGVTVERALIVGTGAPAHTVIEAVRRSPHLGYRIVGLVTDNEGDEACATDVLGVPVLGTVADLVPLIRREKVDEVLIALAGASQARLVELVNRCADDPVNVTVYPDTFQLITNNELSIGDFGGLPMVQVRQIALRGWNRALKRGLDIAVSGVVLVLFSPLLLLLAALVKMSSPGPVFLVQERVGRDNAVFGCLKFRTMRADAEATTGPVMATPNDPRRTKLGSFMRRYSLDEFPQFINVLLGEMSVVGPRPERPHFVDQFAQSIPRYQRRHMEKAGLTGWAVVNGLRGNTSIEERTRYDLYYVENWSLLFDLKIIAKTVVLIFHDRNAY